MLIPVLIVYCMVSVILMFSSVSKQSTTVLILLNLFWWMMAMVAAIFAVWAWSERAYSENWAFLGFLFFSLPTIILTSILAISFVVVGRVKKIAFVRKTETSVFILLLFMLAQALLGMFSVR